MVHALVDINHLSLGIHQAPPELSPLPLCLHFIGLYILCSDMATMCPVLSCLIAFTLAELLRDFLPQLATMTLRLLNGHSIFGLRPFYMSRQNGRTSKGTRVTHGTTLLILLLLLLGRANR